MIREMIMADVPRVAEIHVFTWRYAYRGIVNDEYLFTKMTVEKRVKAFEGIIQRKSGLNYVFDDGIIKGILTFSPCRDEDKPDSYEVWGIYVDPFFENQGIGSEMMNFTLEKAKQGNFKEITLWVLEENFTARKFYEKHGFLPDGKRIFLEHINAYEIRYVKPL